MYPIGRVRQPGSRKQPQWHLVNERLHQPTKLGNALGKNPVKARFPECGSGKGKPADELSFGKPNCKRCLKILAKKEMQEPPTALIDLDGTTADYDTALKEGLKPLWGPNEERVDLHGWHPPHIRARIELIRKQPGWWKTLKPIKKGFEIIELLRNHNFRLMVRKKSGATITFLMLT